MGDLEVMITIRFLLYLSLTILILFLIYAPFSPEIDLAVSRQFYVNDRFVSGPFYDFIYKYGLYPGWIIIAFSSAALLVSLCVRRRKYLRNPALYLLLTLALGSGVIVHAALKDKWGRPRPKQVIEFGGTQSFRPFYKPNFFNQPEPSKSFSCGHCSMGFYFFSVAFLGIYYRKPTIFYFGMLLSLVLGGLLSYVRIAQGGHFLSDVIVSALVMWATSLALYFILPKREERA